MRPRPSVLALLALLLSPTPARATFHLWDISEIYSNADGSIQFVEFFTNANSQGRLLNHSLLSISFENTFTFPSHLPNNTTNRFFLVATPAFATAAGITPDYTLAGPLFFDLDGDTVTLVGADSIRFGPGELPIDGIHSLNETFGGGIRTTAVNTPTNFAGQTGSIVPEPGTACLLLAGLVGIATSGRAPRVDSTNASRRDRACRPYW